LAHARGGPNICLNVCLPEGTEVATAEGLRPIEEIEIGDWVWAWNPETGSLALKPVQELFRQTVSELVIIKVAGEEIRATTEHPFWIDGRGWTPATQIAAGDRLLLITGDLMPVEAVALAEGEFKVYNFEVVEYHTYFVSGLGVSVHNACVYAIMQQMADGSLQVMKYGVSRANFKSNGYLERAARQVNALNKSGAMYRYEPVVNGNSWRAVLDIERNLVEWGKRHLAGGLPLNRRWRPPY
jgi:hypothetical protein